MKNEIIRVLVDELGYSQREAELTADDLLDLHPSLQAAFSQWLRSRTAANLEAEGFTTQKLMLNKKFTYPAALIALDWLLKEPETAKAALSQDIIR